MGGPLKAFQSPIDWRDQWIYFLVVDRFNNSATPPCHQLPNIKGLGAGAV